MSRIILLSGFIFAVVVYLYNRRRAGTPTDAYNEHDDHVLSRLAIRIGSATLALVIALHVSQPGLSFGELQTTATGSNLPWIGAGIGLIGLLLLIWSFDTLGSNWSESVATNSDHDLVTDGPYRWVRHPLYVAFGLLVVAAALLAGSWAIFLLGASVFAGLVFRASLEERRLAEHFGDAYREYAKRTGRFLPKSAIGARRPVAPPGHDRQGG